MDMHHLKIIMIAVILVASCIHKKQGEKIAKKESYYTCSMHPQVMQDHPGNCPICGMKLIEVPKTSTNTNEIHLTAQQIMLGNIIVDTIRSGSIGDRTVLAGTLNFDQQKLSSVSTRSAGRIEKLYTKNIGDHVHKGDKLYDLYSEQLNNAKQEYLGALQQAKSAGNSLINYSVLVESSKNKLILWGMTQQQIDQLVQNKQASALTTFYSSEDGYITALNVKEGEYVAEGGAIVQLAGLTTLWAEAEVYTTQLNGFSKGGKVIVQVPGLNNAPINGTIDFVNPEINPDTRINLVRVTIVNKNNQLHPGMPVYIIAVNKKHNSITLPINGVLMDSKGATVWVQTKIGVYEARMVQVGITDNNMIEVQSGLKEGEAVVISGAYLLNSEYIFEHGAEPMAGMDMSGMKM
jgi:Cu(I)/Ag(I) efflux system membrane fusion protein